MVATTIQYPAFGRLFSLSLFFGSARHGLGGIQEDVPSEVLFTENSRTLVTACWTEFLDTPASCFSEGGKQDGVIACATLGCRINAVDGDQEPRSRADCSRCSD